MATTTPRKATVATELIGLNTYSPTFGRSSALMQSTDFVRTAYVASDFQTVNVARNRLEFKGRR